MVGNKAKGRISKRVFQESKARQNFRKTNNSYPLIRTLTCERRISSEQNGSTEQHIKYSSGEKLLTGAKLLQQ